MKIVKAYKAVSSLGIFVALVTFTEAHFSHGQFTLAAGSGAGQQQVWPAEPISTALTALVNGVGVAATVDTGMDSQPGTSASTEMSMVSGHLTSQGRTSSVEPAPATTSADTGIKGGGLDDEYDDGDDEYVDEYDYEYDYEYDDEYDYEYDDEYDDEYGDKSGSDDDEFELDDE